MKPLLEVIDLGVMDYLPVLKLQEELVEKRRTGEIPDTLLLLEHNAVYTLGRNATEDNITASGQELEKKGIEVVRTTRGGEVTYHGPGQLVGYPILDLGEASGRVVWYVGKLEQVLIETLKGYGIYGATDPGNRGVWVDDRKIAALGVRITRHITMHGFALNVSPRMEDYDGIIPCGIKDKGVTSLETLAPRVTMEMAKKDIVRNFKAVFGYEEVGKGRVSSEKT